MKSKIYYIFLLACFHIFAQPPIDDDMEAYSNGTYIYQNHWTAWNDESEAIIATNQNAYQGEKSGVIPGNGSTSALLNLGNRIFGNNAYYVTFQMYVPSNKEGVFNIQGEVPVNGGESIVGNIWFNKDLLSPGEGYVENSALGQVSFNFPHNQWFQIWMEIDLSIGMQGSTWYLRVDNEVVVPLATYFSDEAGNFPTSLGGLNFFSNSLNTLYYLDEVRYLEPLLSINDYSLKHVIITPNPASEVISFETKSAIIEEIIIYSSLGNILSRQQETSNMDISFLPKGLYLVEISTNKGKEVHRIIKE